MKMDNSMKIRIALGLCVVLGAGFISVRAADTPAQAAARAALVQKLNQPDDPPTQSLPATNTLSQAVVKQPAKSATTVTETVPERAATPQTIPVAALAAIAPAAVSPGAAPATVRHVAVAPAPVAPVAVIPTRSFLIMALLISSPLLVSIVMMSVLLLKLRALKLLLLKHPAIVAPAVVAPREIQPAAALATPKPTLAPTATKRPVQRRKRVHQQNGAESDVNLPKTEWETAKAERRESN
jgi:hypothetical protein